jgi:hypothetical protein
MCSLHSSVFPQISFSAMSVDIKYSSHGLYHHLGLRNSVTEHQSIFHARGGRTRVERVPSECKKREAGKRTNRRTDLKQFDGSQQRPP